MAGDLTTEGFIACFQRFVSRRGLPRLVWSDNGTNFCGFVNLLLDQERIQKMAATMGIRWKFIAVRSPHQGGL